MRATLGGLLSKPTPCHSRMFLESLQLSSASPASRSLIQSNVSQSRTKPRLDLGFVTAMPLEQLNRGVAVAVAVGVMVGV